MFFFFFVGRFEKSGNEAFVRALSGWVFHQSGVLRYSNVTHHIYGQAEPPQFYTIEDDVVSCSQLIVTFFCLLADMVNSSLSAK